MQWLLFKTSYKEMSEEAGNTVPNLPAGMPAPDPASAPGTSASDPNKSGGFDFVFKKPYTPPPKKKVNKTQSRYFE